MGSPVSAHVQAAIQQHWDHIWDAEWTERENARITGREQNLQRYKPGTLDTALIFSDNVGRSVYRFPLLELFQEQLNPVLEKVLTETCALTVIRNAPVLLPSLIAASPATTAPMQCAAILAGSVGRSIRACFRGDMQSMIGRRWESLV